MEIEEPENRNRKKIIDKGPSTIQLENGNASGQERGWSGTRNGNVSTVRGPERGGGALTGKGGNMNGFQMIATANSYAKLVLCCESGGRGDNPGFRV